MMNSSLLSFGRWLLPIPAVLRQREVQRGAVEARKSLDFMSADHHRVRDFVVLELPRRGEPLSPLLIASELNFPLERVGSIVDDLEKRLTFLFRNEDGAVAWAYPVTADPTPHRVFFSTGEQIYAA
jgi:hypothetical protein